MQSIRLQKSSKFLPRRRGGKASLCPHDGVEGVRSAFMTRVRHQTRSNRPCFAASYFAGPWTAIMKTLRSHAGRDRCEQSTKAVPSFPRRNRKSLRLYCRRQTIFESRKMERAKTFRAVKAPLRSSCQERKWSGGVAVCGDPPAPCHPSHTRETFFIPSDFYVPFPDQNNGANKVRKELNSEAKNPILKL